jgi:hypothetical protein
MADKALLRQFKAGESVSKKINKQEAATEVKTTVKATARAKRSFASSPLGPSWYVPSLAATTSLYMQEDRSAGIQARAGGSSAARGRLVACSSSHLAFAIFKHEAGGILVCLCLACCARTACCDVPFRSCGLPFRSELRAARSHGHQEKWGVGLIKGRCTIYWKQLLTPHLDFFVFGHLEWG